MSAQPEALRLAEVLDLLAMDMKTPRQAAAELRRLHALNVELLEALTRIRALPVHADSIRMAHKRAEDAISKAGGAA